MSRGHEPKTSRTWWVVSKAAIIDAVQRLDLDRTRRLLTAKPSLAAVTDRQQRNLLHIACSVSPAKLKVAERVQVRIVDFLLRHGFEIDLPVGRDACTPLFFAVARARSTALVKFLLDRGAKPASAPGGGLFAAGWWDDVANLKLLIGAGARVDVVVGVTPFLACWCWERFEAAKCLALNGADVNFQDPKGRTALHHGIEKEFDPAWLKWLVKSGASPDIPDRHGVSPRLKASRKRDKKFLAALA
jgi:ankyrin repeat protein